VWIFGVIAILFAAAAAAAAAFAYAYAGVTPSAAANALAALSGVFFLAAGGEYLFVAAQARGRAGKLREGREYLRRGGHQGLVVVVSNYAARPRKHGHGDVVMQACLAHADSHPTASRSLPTPATAPSRGSTSSVTASTWSIPPAMTGWWYDFLHSGGRTPDVPAAA